MPGLREGAPNPARPGRIHLDMSSNSQACHQHQPPVPQPPLIGPRVNLWLVVLQIMPRLCSQSTGLQEWGKDGFWGPPYALLQGSLADLARQPPFENKGNSVK